MAKASNSSKKSGPNQTARPAGGWRPVFANDREMRTAFKEFSAAVADDMREFAIARRKGEERIMRGL